MTMYDIIAINANQPQARDIRLSLKGLLLRNGGELYARVEVYLTTPGVAGRPQFDQCLVSHEIRETAIALKDVDADAAVIAEMSHSEIWNYVPKVLGRMGFDVRRGKIVGLLEDKSADDHDDTGMPPAVSVEVAPVMTGFIQ